MKTCENCGCRVYNLGCVNCNAAAYIEEQIQLDAFYGLEDEWIDDGTETVKKRTEVGDARGRRHDA